MPIDLSLKMSPSCHTSSKALNISKQIPLHEIQELSMRQRLYKYYGQWTSIDLHDNHWLKNHNNSQNI